MEGPKPIRAQEEELRGEEKVLSLEEEEKALLEARKSLKSKLDSYRELRGPPSKRVKSSASSTLPGYQLPPTWDIPVISRPGETNKSDIRTYLRPPRCTKTPTQTESSLQGVAEPLVEPQVELQERIQEALGPQPRVGFLRASWHPR